MSTCFICGNQSTTDEHIFPKWLQHRFNLWNQTITLPNNTRIQYKSLTISCCALCNNVILSTIENKIKDGTATIEEIWKWGAKIHYGLLRKDDFLEWDRRNPGYKIGQVIKRHDPIELDRHLIHSIHGDFKTHPNPFGSTYVFDFENEEPYHFAHLVNPAGLCICTGRRGYIIFINDGGSLSRQPSITASYNKHLSRTHLGKMLNFFANCWAHLYRHRVRTPYMMSPNFIAVLGPGKLIEEMPLTDEFFIELWRYITGGLGTKVLSTEEYDACNGVSDTPD